MLGTLSDSSVSAWAEVTLVFPVEKGEREVELELPGRYAVTPALKGAIRHVSGVREVEEV